jgi:hypothetical protein
MSENITVSNELKKQFELLLLEQKKLREQFQETGQKLLKETFAGFFELNPGINAICWTQYTPYFNDGDECVFRVNEPSFTNATGEDLEDIFVPGGEYNGENESIWIVDNVERTLEGGQWYDEDKEKILSGPTVDPESCELISEMITAEEFEDIIKLMFGNHVEIIATRDGFDVSDYDHE